MLILFLQVTLGDDLTDFLYEVLEDSQLAVWGVIVYVLLSMFTLLNMLIGVLCEVVSKTMAEEENNIRFEAVKDMMSDVFAEVDTDGSGMLSGAEFEDMCTDDFFLEALSLLEIEPRHLLSLSSSIFDDVSEPSKLGKTSEQVNTNNAEDSEQATAKRRRSRRGSSRSRASRSEASDQVVSSSSGRPANREEEEEKTRQQRMLVGSSTPVAKPSLESKEEGPKEITFEEFLDLVVHNRPGVPASVLDTGELRTFVNRMGNQLNLKAEAFETRLEKWRSLVLERSQVCEKL